MPEIFPVLVPSFGDHGRNWRITKWLVEDGEYITDSRTIAILANDAGACELESFHAGVIKKVVQVDEALEVGQKIAELLFDERAHHIRLSESFPITIHLTGKELQLLDSCRGEASREIVAKKFIKHRLNQLEG